MNFFLLLSVWCKRDWKSHTIRTKVRGRNQFLNPRGQSGSNAYSWRFCAPTLQTREQNNAGPWGRSCHGLLARLTMQKSACRALILMQSIRRRRPKTEESRSPWNYYYLMHRQRCCNVWSEPLHHHDRQPAQHARRTFCLLTSSECMRIRLSAAEPRVWRWKLLGPHTLAAGEACVAHVCFVCEMRRANRKKKT